MNKAIAILLSICSILALTACSLHADPSTSSDVAPTIEAIEEVTTEQGNAPQDRYENPELGFGKFELLSPEKITTSALPAMSEDMQAIYERYIQGIEWGFPLGISFDEEHYFNDGYLNNITLYLLFDCLLNRDCLAKGEEDSYYPNYPAELVEGMITDYTLLSVEDIRRVIPSGDNTPDYGEYYNTTTDTYFFTGGMGGGTPYTFVSGIRQNGDLLEIDCESYWDNFETGQGYLLMRRNTLTVKLEPDNGYKYIANRVDYQYNP